MISPNFQHKQIELWHQKTNDTPYVIVNLTRRKLKKKVLIIALSIEIGI
jgi:hypothetical protein